jgi:hypothetical protein
MNTNSDKQNGNDNQETKSEVLVNSMLDSTINDNTNAKYNFEDYVDERTLISRDFTGTKEMKIKVIEVSDEHSASQWKFGTRVKLNKILVTIKHLDTQKVEEGEFDIEAIEKELIKKRHYTSTNRWVPTKDIKNGYVINTRHTVLITDASALDYIVF